MQIVGYDRGIGAVPSVTVAGPDGLSTIELEAGSAVAYTLTDRHCAGVVTDDGHEACNSEIAPQCPEHDTTWVCARCTGTCLKAEMDCHEPHAIYLAAFAPDTFKVGVTRDWRLETRLREQGADRAAHLRTVEDGRIAREIEAEWARDIGDSVRVADKVAGLHQTVDEAAFEAVLEPFDPIESYTFEYGLSLSEAPVTETILAGTVRGTKGRILLLEAHETIYAVDLRDLVGYEIAEGSPDRNLQASLAGFQKS